MKKFPNIILAIFAFALSFLLSGLTNAQNLTQKSVEGNTDNLPVREYAISINELAVNRAGKEVMGMAINVYNCNYLPINDLTFGES